MSYRYYVPRRNPVAFWLMDDTSPYQEHGGLFYTGNTRSGYSAATAATPLVAGAQFSSVFSNIKQAEFNCPLFQQGDEKKRFALESWVLPIPKTSGLNAQTYRDNLAQRPRTINTTGWGQGGPPGPLSATSDVVVGTYIKFTFTGAFTGTAAMYYGGTTLFRTPVTAGKTYSFSSVASYSYAGVATLNAACRIAWFDSAGVQVGSTSSGPTVTLSNGVWATMKNENQVAPAGAVTVRIDTLGFTATVASGDYLAATNIQMNEGATVNPYLDGSMVGHEWTGTADLSTSRTRRDVAYMNLAVDTKPANINMAGGTSTNTIETTGGPLPNSPGWFKAAITAPATGSPISMTVNSARRATVVAGRTYSFGAYMYTSTPPTGGMRLDILWYNSAGTLLSTINGTQSSSPAGWAQRTVLNRVAPAGAVKASVSLAFSTPTNMLAGSVIGAAGIQVVESATLPYGFFDGNSPGAIWNGAANTSESLMLVSQAEQQVLGNAGQMDGITVNGSVINFVTKFLTSGECRCVYDMGVLANAHVVGIHTDVGNQLYVNGVLVDNELFTDAQKVDLFVTTDTKLYTGTTASSQEIAVNGIAVYSNITPAQILQNYTAGIKSVPQKSVGTQYDGITFNMNGDSGSKYIDRSFKVNDDFSVGLINNVQINSDLVGPEYDITGLSEAGSWTVGVSLDDYNPTSIYGVMVEWSGIGITVDASLDGTTWTSLTNGALIPTITSGYNPTGVDLQVRVNFSVGYSFGYAFLESLRVVGFLNNTFVNGEQRAISTTWPAVLREDYEPILYRDDNGVSLHGATLTIGPDLASTPVPARTLEVWIKPLVSSPTISVTGTQYRNGALDSTLPVGEWSLVTIVSSSDITSNITITGDCIIGQVTLYQTSLTATQVLNLFKSYTGSPSFVFVDTSGITIAEQSPVPATVYAHDWAIDGGGG